MLSIVTADGPLDARCHEHANYAALVVTKRAGQGAIALLLAELAR
jgi:hypothetical protein